MHSAIHIQPNFHPSHQWRSSSALKTGKQEGQVQSSIMLVNIAIRSFLQNSSKHRLGSLRKTPTEGTPPTGPDLTSGQLTLIPQPNPIFLQNQPNLTRGSTLHFSYRSTDCNITESKQL